MLCMLLLQQYDRQCVMCCNNYASTMPISNAVGAHAHQVHTHSHESWQHPCHAQVHNCVACLQKNQEPTMPEDGEDDWDFDGSSTDDDLDMCSSSGDGSDLDQDDDECSLEECDPEKVHQEAGT